MALLKNPLSQFRSYNYRWSFGVIAPGENNNPSSYKNSGGNIVIIRSGGLPDKPVKTEIEKKLGINLEFFIDDINIEALISPNPSTGVSSSVTIDFTVTEPYSIGLFFQSLIAGVSEAGYPDPNTTYLNAHFFLTCEFIGWTPESKTPTVIEKRTFVIKLINCTFRVDSGGTVYNISALPINHYAFSDEVQNMRTNMEIYGLTVASKLNNLCETLNKQEQTKVQENEKKVGDEYVIRFPDPNEGTTSGYGKSNDIISTFIPMGTVSSSGSGSENYIGSSPIIKDFTELGKTPFALEALYIDEQTVQFENFTVDKNSRVFYFNEGTRIEQIINDVILTSKWGQTLLERQPDAKGMVDWFRIDSKIEIIDLEEMRYSGRPAYRYIYNVIPWKMHSSKFQETAAPQDYTPNIKDCVKAYYYSYTGKNEDIIDFNFEINTAFFKPITNLQAGLDSNTAYVVAPDRDRQSRDIVAAPVPTQSRFPSGPRPTVANVTTENTIPSGAGIDTNEMRVANLFNIMVLNSDVDNVELKLRIWGDPYYLSDSDAGNYRAGPSGQYINSDKLIDYQRSEIDVLLSFNSGIDYAKNNLMPIDPIVAFNGLYRVINLVSTFSKGQFTQELTLLRRPNQKIEDVKISDSLVQAFTGNFDTSAITDALDNVENVGALFDFFIKNKPEEFLKFTRIGQLNLVGIDKLLGTQVFQLFGQAQELIETGQKIQSNIKQALSVLQNPQGALTELTQNIEQQLKNPVTALQGAFQGFEGFVSDPGLAASQIPNGTNSIPVPKNVEPPKFPPGDPTKLGPQ